MATTKRDLECKLEIVNRLMGADDSIFRLYYDGSRVALIDGYNVTVIGFHSKKEMGGLLAAFIAGARRFKDKEEGVKVVEFLGHLWKVPHKAVFVAVNICHQKVVWYDSHPLHITKTAYVFVGINYECGDAELIGHQEFTTATAI